MSTEVTLADRMKSLETASRTRLDDRVPVILRVDGKAFHTLLRGVEAHTESVNNVMDRVAFELCKNVQGAQIAYVQSDEVSVLIHSYKRPESCAWFDNQVQKMCSVAASIAATTFTIFSSDIFGVSKVALFDARVFNVPEHEVCNYFIWRQQDAIRNSVSGQARRFFSHKELQNKNSQEMKEMLDAASHSWNSLSLGQQRGRCVYRSSWRSNNELRQAWLTNPFIPMFVEDRKFIDNFLAKEAEE